MRKVIIIATLLIAGIYANAQDSLTHKSIIVYEFKDFNIILVAQSVTDSLLIQPGARTQSPSKQRILSVYGTWFNIFVTSNKAPFQYPVNKVAFDGSIKANETMAIEDLETRSGIYNWGKQGDWKEIKNFPLLNKDSSISLFPSTSGQLPVTKGNYYLLRQVLYGGYYIGVISIRNKTTKEEILNFRVRLLEDPVIPFLTHATQNSYEKKLVDSFLEVKSRMTDIPDNAYMRRKRSGDSLNLPVKVPDSSKILRNENLYETSDLVLYFKKQRSNFPDSSMEYRLLSEMNKDTNWIKTGHKLVVSHFAPENHYKLQVRYELHPAFIQEHTFYIVPKWYQATTTKIIFACLLVFAALSAWLFTNSRRLIKSRRRKEQLSLEIKSIRSQLNPHFIFNALSSIQGLINKNDIPAANHYLTEFSTLLRESLHHNDKEMVPLVTEVNLLETYLKLEQLRFNFKYAINIDEAINKNATEIPYLILQPLVENAVKHGVSTLGEKGLIEIDFIKREHDLLVRISDNGNKFDETQATDGFGLKLTKNRISLLSQTLREQPIKLTIERRQDMETIVNLVFINWV